jgi:hypothetical protein
LTTPAQPQPAPQPPKPATPAAPPAHETLGQRIGGWFDHGEQDAAKLAAGFQSLLQDRSGEALDVAGDFLALVKLVDPAAAPLASSVQALLPKVLSMAENAARDARTALTPPSAKTTS